MWPFFIAVIADTKYNEISKVSILFYNATGIYYQ